MEHHDKAYCAALCSSFVANSPRRVNGLYTQGWEDCWTTIINQCIIIEDFIAALDPSIREAFSQAVIDEAIWLRVKKATKEVKMANADGYITLEELPAFLKTLEEIK